MAAPHLTKFTWLECRSTFKRPATAFVRNAPCCIEIRSCPSCGGSAFLMGSDFRAPPKRDDRAWAIVDLLVRSGFPYFRLHEDVPLSERGDPAHLASGALSEQRRLAYPRTLRGGAIRG
jgi:hypothetical protein